MLNAESLRHLPTKISPCPIIEAIAEVRFQSNIPHSVLPGMIYAAIRDRFPTQQDLPNSQIPEALRIANPALRYQHTIRFLGEGLTLSVGAQVFSISCTAGQYPGWTAYEEMLSFLIERFRPLGFIRTLERLGLRYLDFFELPVVDKLQLELLVSGNSLMSAPLHISCQLQREAFACLLQLNTASTVQIAGKQLFGAVLDLDVAFMLKSSTFPDLVLDTFKQAHVLQKKMFFEELLKREYLTKLNPVYE